MKDNKLEIGDKITVHEPNLSYVATIQSVNERLAWARCSHNAMMVVRFLIDISGGIEQEPFHPLSTYLLKTKENV